ncbi:CD276 antigen isoform X2 [Natator depressus]|uniref:CD276 antigen isoform X2 n=1 Tax=Natator depressus TaxID=27790 RepID=UPI003EC01245
MPCPLLILVLLVLAPAGSVDIRVPDDPVIALFGRDAVLHCSFLPDTSFSLAELSLIWQLTDTKRLVHSFASGRDQLADQGSGYVNRTALFYEELPRGNVSLLLRRVQISDEGSFTCFVRVHSYSSAAVTLQVAGERREEVLAVERHLGRPSPYVPWQSHAHLGLTPALYSKPNLNLEPSKNLKPGDLVTVTCHTFRGYPAATVLWQDGQGNNITENVTTSQVANEEGLFDVQSVLQVVLEPNSTYSCLVRNPVLQQETHASVTITGQHLTFPAVALWVTVGLAICILGLLGALAYVCRKKIRQSCKEEEENAALQPLKSPENKEGNEQEID